MNPAGSADAHIREFIHNSDENAEWASALVFICRWLAANDARPSLEIEALLELQGQTARWASTLPITLSRGAKHRVQD